MYLYCRNCLVGRRYEIKVSDLGSYRQIYSSDYCRIAGSRPLPLRWMAWETVLLVSANLRFVNIHASRFPKYGRGREYRLHLLK